MKKIALAVFSCLILAAPSFAMDKVDVKERPKVQKEFVKKQHQNKVYKQKHKNLKAQKNIKSHKKFKPYKNIHYMNAHNKYRHSHRLGHYNKYKKHYGFYNPYSKHNKHIYRRTFYPHI